MKILKERKTIVNISHEYRHEHSQHNTNKSNTTMNKSNYIHQWDLFQVCMPGPIFKNQSIQSTASTSKRRKITHLCQLIQE